LRAETRRAATDVLDLELQPAKGLALLFLEDADDERWPTKQILDRID